MIDDGHAIADPLHLGQKVGVEEHGRAPVAQRADDAAHVLPADRIEGRRRLVEDDQLGAAEQRHGQPQTLLHPLREGPRSTVRSIRQADQLDGGLNLRLPVGPGQARQLAVQSQDLARGHPTLVAEQLR